MMHYAAAGLAVVFFATGAARELANQRSWGPQDWQPLGRALVRTLVRTGLAMLLGVGLASFYLLPAIYEQGWINIGQVLSPGRTMIMDVGLASFYLLPAIYEQGWINIGQVLSPGVRPQDNFLFTTLPDPDHNHFNLLVSTVAVVEIGILAFAIWFSRRWRGERAEIGT